MQYNREIISIIITVLLFSGCTGVSYKTKSFAGRPLREIVPESFHLGVQDSMTTAGAGPILVRCRVVPPDSRTLVPTRRTPPCGWSR